GAHHADHLVARALDLRDLLVPLALDVPDALGHLALHRGDLLVAIALGRRDLLRAPLVRRARFLGALLLELRLARREPLLGLVLDLLELLFVLGLRGRRLARLTRREPLFFLRVLGADVRDLLLMRAMQRAELRVGLGLELALANR